MSCKKTVNERFRCLPRPIKRYIKIPDTDIVIYGYTDSTGRLELNQKLSEDRAAAVRNYLVNKGLIAARFQTKGMGPNDPIASNDTPEGRSKNRRVEFAITANEKMIKDTEQEIKK